MRVSLRRALSLSLLAGALGLEALACGGRASARAVTSAGPPPISDWERPSRMGDAKPAIRLDRPDACVGECAEDETTAPADKVDGVRVSLQRGMTLYSLARQHQVPVQTIMQVNGISDPTTIPAGTEIYIPVSVVAADPPRAAPRAPRPAARTKTAPMSIVWPLDGRITGGFGLRGRHHHHDGIDIDGTRGEEVRAVAAGIVVRSGSDGKYGRTVVIDHGNGLTTLYAHASRLLVSEGDRIEQGEAIAEVGATGNAHGTHLHFEVRRDGRPVDPLPYLRPEIMGPASR